jgi:hypothetical protein
MAWVLALFKNPMVAFTVIKEVISIARAIQDILNPRKSPVDHIAEKQKQNEEALQDAANNNDTSGLFGGSK